MDEKKKLLKDEDLEAVSGGVLSSESQAGTDSLKPEKQSSKYVIGVFGRKGESVDPDNH